MPNAYKIAILEGDAIGPEIMAQAIRVLDLLAIHRDVAFELIKAPFGAGAYFDNGKAFPDETKIVCDNADAILKGPVGLSHEESKKYRLKSRRKEEPFFPCVRATTPLPTFALYSSVRKWRIFHLLNPR